jgi:hypothetical protein
MSTALGDHAESRALRDASPHGEILADVTTPGDPVPQRIGDAERDRAIELLRDHMAEGRLDQNEFDERLTAALSAKTSNDLDPLFTDLPGPRPGTSVVPSGTQAPPWQAQNAVTPVTPSTGAVAPAEPKWNRALVAASGIAWPVTILLITFAFGWQYWWLIFIQVMISSMAGNNRHQSGRGRGHHRDRDRDRDERRGIDS